MANGESNRALYRVVCVFFASVLRVLRFRFRFRPLAFPSRIPHFSQGILEDQAEP